jgi:hypothetical protein
VRLTLAKIGSQGPLRPAWGLNDATKPLTSVPAKDEESPRPEVPRLPTKTPAETIECVLLVSTLTTVEKQKSEGW